MSVSASSMYFQSTKSVAPEQSFTTRGFYLRDFGPNKVGELSGKAKQ